ncbi:hypothetical protein AJ78_00830 [Emergomyces pasteurianus Ep9510]|uniref:WW domain-containing protein n=1 Tax=Emergomyces pasteurianus Ep9510 TaxID=1447872 RepID=A0A1J9PS25_9EURO|nr:hypothetical protein AJ78_00830 [Emergomyces pasteurianus Ep9510]
MASDAATPKAATNAQLPAGLEDAPQSESESPETPKDESRKRSRNSKDAEQKEELGDKDNDDDKKSGEELEEGEEEEDAEEEGEEHDNSAPPLPQEDLPPPLPNETPPGQTEDDGWDPVWDDSAQAYYFYNRFTGLSQWENPRVPVRQQQAQQLDTPPSQERQQPNKPRVAGGYDPAIHGDYDPTAPYAQVAQQQEELNAASAAAGYSSDPNYIYTATGTFNRFTGKWQPGALAPENFTQENKSRRQMNAYFDVDAAANSHDGKSLKAERSGKRLTKKELKAFKEKRRERKEEKRRAWLRD